MPFIERKSRPETKVIHSFCGVLKIRLLQDTQLKPTRRQWDTEVWSSELGAKFWAQAKIDYKLLQLFLSICGEIGFKGFSVTCDSL
mgnify:CR=1 FL=1